MSRAATLPTTPVDIDLDEGTQPADINSIGGTGQRFPWKVTLFFAVAITAVLALGYYFAKREINSMFEQKNQATAKKKEAAQGPQSAPFASNKPRPFATSAENTPMDSDWPLATNPASGGAAPTAGQRGLDAAPSPSAPNACPVTAVVDKRTGYAVRDAQGQPLMIDCKGTAISSSNGVPAPQFGANPLSAPAGYAGAAYAAPAPVPSRYAGDTLLGAPKPQTSGFPSGVPGMQGMPGATLPPRPNLPSSAALEDQLKRVMAGNAPGAVAPAANSNPILSGGGNPATPPNPQGAMGGLLSPTSTPKAMAVRSFDPHLTIPKGDSINCAMTTRVVTEISGFTSCIVTENVYSANGKVLLVERMSEMQGEYTAVGQPGQRRVYVLWSRIRKPSSPADPNGITIDLASPSTDSLGAAGIDGIVDNRWFERIGSAYMLSIFKDFLAADAARSAPSSGGAAGQQYQNSLQTSQSLAEKVLNQSINIKPVVYAHQGERIAIYVARDLDFSGVYQVTPSGK